MSVITSMADLREVAARRVPRAIFDYADRGSYDEITIRRNRADLEAIKLRQRVMIDLSERSVATTVLGEPWSFPVGIAPTGLTGRFHQNGEIQGARAAEKAGLPVEERTIASCDTDPCHNRPTPER